MRQSRPMPTSLARTATVASLIALASPLWGCCFGAMAEGFQQGMNTELECQPLIDTVNRASGGVNAVPETPAGSEQSLFDAEYNAVAVAYDDGANALAGVALTQPALIAPRDELVTLYREGGAGMRAMPGLVAAGDPAALDAHVARYSDFETRESQIVARINAACNRQ
ncbi:MAG: hypothetical protein J0L92_31535 [Deltaproteobacteria bacterium]|nr:hypothetical protein [Deltaproteobacteria bacterium]